MASQQYSIAKHTILPMIFKITHRNTLSYLIKDSVTKSLLLMPSIDQMDGIKQHVINIQQQFQCNLTHTFINTNQGDKVKPLFNEKIITPQIQGELKPQLIGQLSICYIKAAGYQPDYNLIAATHITPTSTKFPVLFVGKMISVCSIDLDSSASAQNYCYSIDKLKYFPSQTYIFPSKKANLQDLQFASALQKNSFLDEKIQTLKTRGSELSDCLIPTSILEQKLMNPFFSPQKYKLDLLKNKDRFQSFGILRQIRNKWKQ